MLFALLSAAVALACVAASVRRFVTAVAPTALDPAVLAGALERDPDGGAATLARLRAVVDARPDLEWERDLLAAFDERDLRMREALVNEQLLDLEARTRAWSRAPRVCASISTSAGFLFGLLALLGGLQEAAGDDVQDALHGTLGSALAALSIGIAGTAFCAAIHVRAGKASRARLVAVDRLVDRLGRIADAAAPAPTAGGGGGEGTPSEPGRPGEAGE